MSLILLLGARDAVSQADTVVGSAVEDSARAARLRTPAPVPSTRSEADRRPFVAGDALRIVVFPDTNSFLNGVYPVGSDGCIFLPMAGRKKVTDLSAEELANYLNSAYIDFLRYPNVQVMPLVRVSLIGAFYRPGLYYIEPTTSLWDAVRAAGGPQRDDGLQSLRWERDRETVESNLIPLLESGHSLDRLGFKSGDQVYAPERKDRTAMDVLQRTVFPLVTVTLSTIVTSLTLYQLSREWR